MSGTGPYDFQLPDLRIVPSDLLVPHEREDEARTGRLSERIRRSGVLKNPPIVTEARSPERGECFVVLDGANRVSVARDSDLPHFLVQVVRYDDAAVKLTTWHHALSGFPYERLERELQRVPGLTLRLEDLGHARALLARREAIAYIVVQVIGGIVGAGVLYLIASGQADFSLAGGFASNGYDMHSPGRYSMTAGLVSEVVMTFMFLIIILGTTHKRAPGGFAGLAIGLGLTLIHLISIPVTNTSVNPARSTATAVFVGGWALQQLWLFWIAPIIGAAVAGVVYKAVLEGPIEEPPVTGRTR